MLRSLLLRHIHAALRSAAVLHAHAHLGRFGAGVVAQYAQSSTAAFDVKGLDGRLGQAVVLYRLGLVQLLRLACARHLTVWCRGPALWQFPYEFDMDSDNTW
jgi:hypothetical protein